MCKNFIVRDHQIMIAHILHQRMYSDDISVRVEHRTCVKLTVGCWMMLGIDPGLQLFLAKKYKLPLFLHCRAAHQDFVSILRDEGFGEDGERKGVVHSFTGSVEEVIELVRSRVIYYSSDFAHSDTQMDMGFHIRCCYSINIEF
jgi:hypothetical protein